MTTTSPKRPLYIFLHIPKCAGTTFRHHIRHRYRDEQALKIDYDVDYTDIRTGSSANFRSRADIDAYLGALTEAQKDEVVVLYGHHVYWGIHRFFDRTPRYLTLVRQPETHAVSMYNFYRGSLDGSPAYPFLGVVWHRKKFLEDVYRDTIEDATPIPLGRFVSERDWLKNFSFSFLQQQSFVSAGDELADVVKKFYFVGTTETYHRDGVFMYYLLNILGAYPDQNVSRTYATTQEERMAKEAVRAMSPLDAALYAQVCVHNQNFRKRTPSFWVIVMFTHACRTCYRLVAPLLHAFYRASARLKRASPFYEVSVGVIKRHVWKG